jgi:uncharacterized membrane protein YqiK
METNQLAVIVNESGLEKSKADVLLENFSDYFKLAGEWERKAKVLEVTDASQVAEMKMAREGRLFLKEKRVALEKTRKALKEQALREGKAIDGIANVLKALIVPIEQYLDEQEHFVERQEAERAEAARLEAEAKGQAEWLEAEKKYAKEQERIRLENARLREEAEAKEKQMQAEREQAEAERQRAAAAAKAECERVAAEAAKEKAELAAERAEKERIQAALDEQIECPFCHKKFTLAVK